MKKIIIGLFVFSFLLIGNSALAAWNTDPLDCPGSGIGNFSTGVGIPSGLNNCWNSSNVSATDGQTVNVQLYYHNTGTTAAANTKLYISVSPALGQVASSHTFTSSLTSDQGGSINLGSTTVTLSTPQALSAGSTYWYPNQTHSPTISGTQMVTSSGLSIGSVNSGWAGQGSAVLDFKVGTGNVQPNNCVITNFNASPNSINSWGSSTLSWNTTNCTSVNISPNVGSVNTGYGSQIVSPTYTTTYILTAYGANGGQQSQSVTVSVNSNQNNCTISYFNANPNSINTGGSSTLTWNTNNCTSVNISNLNYNVPVTYGNQIVYPTYTTTYTLTAYGTNGGQQSQSVTVSVNNNNQNNNCSISYFTASPNSINSGSASTLSWNTINCSSVSIAGLNYTLASSGSQIVYPPATINYVLTAYGINGGQQTQSATVSVINNYIPPVSACAVSTVSTNVNQNSATLNGMLVGTGNYSTYFEYGRSASLGSQTIARSSNGSTIFSDIVTGLNSGTIYYFRIVSNCQNGSTSRGDLKVFQTLAANVRPIIVQGTTVVGTSSPIMLKIENRYQGIKEGDIVDYTVTYKNIGSRTLTHPMVQVVLPDGVTFINSSRGTYVENNKTLSVPIDDLKPNDEGVIYLQGRVDILSNNTEVVTTALLIYTNDKGAQENAMAYVLNNPRSDNGLSANAFFSGFLGLGIIGWLLIIIIILLIILIYRRYFDKKLYTNTKTNTLIKTDSHS